MHRTLAVMALLALVAGACGGAEATLKVEEAWARPAIGPNGAVYLTIEGGATDTALTAVSASTDVAAAVEIHQTVIRDNGAMGMTRIPRLEVPAESTLIMVPGGMHIMLIDLAKPLALGDTFDVTLTFESGTDLTSTVEVREE